MAQLAYIKQMSRQVSGGSAGDYQGTKMSKSSAEFLNLTIYLLMFCVPFAAELLCTLAPPLAYLEGFLRTISYIP